MDSLNKQYEKIVTERKELIERIKTLETEETVKEYLSICNQNAELASKQRELYEQIKVEKYSTCNHIWVIALRDYDSREGRRYDYHGCIKCGLDQRIGYLSDFSFNLDSLSLDQRIMYDFMKDNQYFYGIKTGMLCDLDLAMAIYSKIIENHPDIDDDTAVKYFKIALYNIRNIDVTDERKANRARRLSLTPDFKQWSARSIVRY